MRRREEGCGRKEGGRGSYNACPPPSFFPCSYIIAPSENGQANQLWRWRSRSGNCQAHSELSSRTLPVGTLSLETPTRNPVFGILYFAISTKIRWSSCIDVWEKNVRHNYYDCSTHRNPPRKGAKFSVTSVRCVSRSIIQIEDPGNQEKLARHRIKRHVALADRLHRLILSS